MTHDREKSGSAVVAVKPANAVSGTAAEPVEPRAGAEGNANQQSTRRTQCRASVSQALERIRQAARQRKEERFTALFHHISTDLLYEAFHELKEEAAPGVDGLTWKAYQAELEPRLEDLHGRVQRGAYRAQPSRRVYIPKPDGRERPIAVAALEDKIVQRATATLLNAIYEEDFLGFSYGFRPGRGAHDALDALVVGIMSRKVNFILDADIRSFFDEVSQDWLIRFVEQRIGDKRIIRLIRKWLKAGILEDGVLTQSDKGTGQGAVISPLLANIYLHYVLDLWAERWRRREAAGDMIVVRYADDFVVGFEHEADARRFLEAMRERLAEFALSLHPDKTRLIEFGRFAAQNREQRGLGKPETFNFLGFTFICGKTRRGKFLIRRKTRRDRMRAKLKAIKQELRRRMHQPIPAQGKWLGQVVRGYFNYFAVPTNGQALSAFRFHVIDLWRRTLRGRSQTDGTTWQRVGRWVNDWLPKPNILHPWPSARFAVTHPRWEPYAGKPHVRFCAGGAQ
ncbi:MAG: group II intron reverse transcriptase/maturase [Hyphomicrobiales bacterium]|nr:group II intron reverse transcriptase/maturase [Hyphomicrobiales bacterium]